MIALILYWSITSVISYGYWGIEDDDTRDRIGRLFIGLASGWIVVPYQIGKLIRKHL